MDRSIVLIGRVVCGVVDERFDLAFVGSDCRMRHEVDIGSAQRMRAEEDAGRFDNMSHRRIGAGQMAVVVVSARKDVL